jgi:MraZ protein
MFLGRAEISMDEKGRITFPVRFRDIVSDKGAFITKGFDDNLIIVDSERYMDFSNKLSQMSTLDDEAQQTRRDWYSLAAEVTLDSAGRFLLQPYLRIAASLENTVTFVGMGTYLELWNPTLLAARDSAPRGKEALMQRYHDLNLTL